MRKEWYVPLAIAGISGLGLLLFTDRGRNGLRWLAQNIHHAPGRLLEWNEAAQRELDRIQTALNRVASSLEGVR